MARKLTLSAGLVPGVPRPRPSEPVGAGSPPSPASAALDDATLVVRAREEDITAFDALVRCYRLPVYRIAAHILADPPSAADKTQEAFISAWRLLHEIKAEQAFAAWLYRIAVTRALSAVRALRQAVRPADGVFPHVNPRIRGLSRYISCGTQDSVAALSGVWCGRAGSQPRPWRNHCPFRG